MIRFKLVDDWWWVLTRSHSERANILGILCLVLPEALYAWFGFDVAAPSFWWLLGLALLVYGTVFRLKKQRE